MQAACVYETILKPNAGLVVRTDLFYVCRVVGRELLLWWRRRHHLVGLVPLHRLGPGTNGGWIVGLFAVQPARQRPFGADVAIPVELIL